MTIEMKPDAIRAGWAYADNASAEMRKARDETDRAAGTDMVDLAATLTDAATDAGGVLDVVLSVIGEHHTNVEACISDFQATDGKSAGEFHGLSR